MIHRHRILLELLQTGMIRLRETAQLLGVAEMTIRRDFRELEARKLLLQVKGGAIPYPVQYASNAALQQLNETKFAIARRLFLEICPCESMFIGTGATCLAFAQTIARSKIAPMTIITHSLSVGSVLFRTKHKVILLGGELRSTNMDLLGPVAEKNLLEYKVEWLVTGCDGALSNLGFYTSDKNLSELEKKSISISESVAVITESWKFGCRSFKRFADLDEVDLLITDNAIKQEDMDALKKSPIRVTIVR